VAALAGAWRRLVRYRLALRGGCLRAVLRAGLRRFVVGGFRRLSGIAVVGSGLGTRPASGLRRLMTRRVWVRTISVRSRSVTSSGVAKKIDE